MAIRQGSRVSPWWAVPLMWVWAMCHGMWPLGVIIGAVAVVGLLVDGRSAAGEPPASRPCRSWPGSSQGC